MKQLFRFFNWLRKVPGRKPGDWMSDQEKAKAAGEDASLVGKPLSIWGGEYNYNPEAEYEEFKNPVPNPVLAFHESLIKGEKEVDEAWIYEACVDQNGKLMEDKKYLEARGLVTPYRVRRVSGEEYKRLVVESQKLYEKFPEYLKSLESSRKKALEAIAIMHKEHLLEDVDFAQDITSTVYDANQYTEYTPLYGGPFNKQLYLTDYLTMHSRAFEAKNHNPLARRIIDLLAQYSFGRRFKVRWKDPKKEKAWKDANAKHKIVHRCSEFWIREYLTYGELMIDKTDWQSIDPSTVWDIITDPDDITKVFYYHQSYATAYQTFTGYQVPGAPAGGAKQPSQKYIIRQIPGPQMIHLKGNVVSQEKRGRSVLFSVLGWMKRMKDLYDAKVIKAQLNAHFLWDDTIDGDAASVSAHISAYAKMPPKATIFAHNKAIERKALNALSTGGGRGGDDSGNEILAFIATAIGIPKDFFNVIASSGGNRATALVGAEPFEKVIEDLQAKFENLLLTIAEEVIEQAGFEYEEGDVEFVFPSVTKDTTSETIKNIATGETLGYIDHQAAAEMFAAEMNYTNFDYDAVQDRIKKDQSAGIVPVPMPPAGRFGMNGNGNGNSDDGSVHDGDNPLHGTPKKNLKSQIGNL